jgi:hypothetical protein
LGVVKLSRWGTRDKISKSKARALNSFIHSFDKYLLSTYYVPGIFF